MIWNLASFGRVDKMNRASVGIFEILIVQDELMRKSNEREPMKKFKIELLKKSCCYKNNGVIYVKSVRLLKSVHPVRGMQLYRIIFRILPN